ncbi:hypothetical protein C7M84_009391 [Penaeus vannamei]|uniref:Uncharacterized protein n=1 Tax=Penaeus vannamei TaxID=6689 RepID=A0A3R7P0R6_PENVA|nr:hypothetical protein C7M84_009391 [Penaeus vannamei]
MAARSTNEAPKAPPRSSPRRRALLGRLQLRRDLAGSSAALAPGAAPPRWRWRTCRAPRRRPWPSRGPLHGVPDLAKQEADRVGVGGAGAGSSDQKLRRQPLAPEGAVGLVADDAALGRGRAEVDDGDAERLVQHDVVGLQVVVDEALGVDLVHTAAQLHGDVHRLGLVPPLAAQGLLQRARARARDEHGCRLSAQPQGEGAPPAPWRRHRTRKLVLEVLVAAALGGLLEHGLLLAPADEPRLAVSAAAQEPDVPRRLQEADLLRRQESRRPSDANFLPLASGLLLSRRLDSKGGGRRRLPPPHAHLSPRLRGVCGSSTARRDVSSFVYEAWHRLASAAWPSGASNIPNKVASSSASADILRFFRLQDSPSLA